MLDKDAYRGREQTYVKHYVLEKYLDRLAHKIGYSGCTLNYIDGFAGPWRAQDERLRDTSPFIAMAELAKARRDLASRGAGPLRVRCLFIEKDRASCEKLREATQTAPNGIEEVQVIHGELEGHVEQATAFAQQGTRPFGFVFIDPTGWKGLSLNRIQPLLRLEYGEVLVNFMIEHIRRFIDLKGEGGEEERLGFEELFGGPICREEWQELKGLDRDDKIVSTYLRRLKDAGGFAFTASALILNTLSDRTHFHLAYGTRRIDGLLEFRRVEQRLQTIQDEVRAEAQKIARVRRMGGQQELFGTGLSKPYNEELYRRYLSYALIAVEDYLEQKSTVLYDDLVSFALEYPMTSMKDLNEFLVSLRKALKVEIVGLKARERTPRRGAGHEIRWTAR